MRGIDLFCASQASTSIRLTSMDHNASSSSSTVHLGSSRLIDRHNPIITDRTRVQGQSRASEDPDLLVEPQYNIEKFAHEILNPKAELASRIIKSPPSIPKPAPVPENDKAKKSKKKKNKENSNSDFASRISCAKSGGFISPSGSTRFLLGDRTGLLEVVPDCEPFVPVLPTKPVENEYMFETGKKLDVEAGSVSNRGSSSRSSDQVVVLRVSLHCKGCAGKVKKHISRMQGVTSFNIDFAAKKVTVVGDVTPLEVLASISKVKNAKLWTPPKPPSLPSTTLSTYSEINKSKTVVA